MITIYRRARSPLKMLVDWLHGARYLGHTCLSCRFLGRHGECDLYYCPQGGFPTVLARWSNQGPDYLSGWSFGKMSRYDFSNHMGEAYRRAVKLGLPAGKD